MLHITGLNSGTPGSRGGTPGSCGGLAATPGGESYSIGNFESSSLVFRQPCQ